VRLDTSSADHVDGPWRYERLDGLGHWMQLEAPDAVNALLIDFLAAGRSQEREPPTRRRR
jgi:pimeloyl-ACP methyl ester carboxylesterase